MHNLIFKNIMYGDALMTNINFFTMVNLQTLFIYKIYYNINYTFIIFF